MEKVEAAGKTKTRDELKTMRQDIETVNMKSKQIIKR